LQKAENRDPRFFYGYIVVLLSFCIMLAGDGIFYSFGIFFNPLLVEFGWTRAATSGAYSLCVIVTGLLSIVVGRLNDRFGPRLILTACGLFLGLGYSLMSQVTTIWQLYLLYGLLISMGESSFLVPLQSTVARWFVRRRGLMTGITMAGVGVGTATIPPLASRLISIYGWRISYVIVGSVISVFIIIAAQFLRRDPKQKGLSPYGENDVKGEIIDATVVELPVREIVHAPRFWLLCVISFCFYFCVATIMVHVVIHAIGLGIPAVSAANILAIIGGGSIAGRLILGITADNIGNKLALIISCIPMSIALFWLVTIQKEIWMFYLFAAIFGFSYGGIVALKSPLTAELFGLSSHGVILGITLFAESIGGVIGPVLAGGIFDITGSYQPAFLICIALSVTSIILAIMLSSSR